LEDIEEYQKDYQEFSSKFLTEEKRKDIGKQRDGRQRAFKDIKEMVTGNNIDKYLKIHLSAIACRKNIIKKIQPQYKKIPRMIYGMDTGSEVIANKNKIINSCRNRRCITGWDGSGDITKSHICPKLKYKKNFYRFQGNTDDKCCDLSLFEKVILFFQDLF
jgi:hypothetical protein